MDLRVSKLDTVGLFMDTGFNAKARKAATEAGLSVRNMGSKRFNAEIAEGRRETQSRQITGAGRWPPLHW